jgi:hypothetical protein
VKLAKTFDECSIEGIPLQGPRIELSNFSQEMGSKRFEIRNTVSPTPTFHEMSTLFESLEENEHPAVESREVLSPQFASVAKCLLDNFRRVWIYVAPVLAGFLSFRLDD